MNADQNFLVEKHNFVNESIFRFKVILLIFYRSILNLITPVKRFKNNDRFTEFPIVARSESDLWNPDDHAENWILTAGKIENLRIASGKLNGLEVEANEIFSFWKHIGNPNFGKGFVVGREIREGCIVPTIAGGLCQLSNALYDAALKANFEIMERHRHSKVIKGSLAEHSRDATVKWNYVDLRFKSLYAFKMQIELTSNKLTVLFRGKPTGNQIHNKFIENNRKTNYLNDCYSCGNLSCYKHPTKVINQQKTTMTTFILDEKWPEYDDYIKSNSLSDDLFIVPFKNDLFKRGDRYSWTTGKTKKIKPFTYTALMRSLSYRVAEKLKNNIYQLGLKYDRKIAGRASKLIPVESTHVVVMQNILPFLYETGSLGGRTFDVLMTRLPMEHLQKRLDFAHSIYPDSKTLNDFRASEYLVELENKALTKANKIITPHQDISNLFHNKSIRLKWKMPQSRKIINTGKSILYPASLFGRKGAYEIKKLARELNMPISIMRDGLESKNFWDEKYFRKFNGNFDEIGLAVYPTFIEHKPRQILNLISKGIPVITTPACGIEKSELIRIVNYGDYQQLKNEVLDILERKTPVK